MRRKSTGRVWDRGWGRGRRAPVRGAGPGLTRIVGPALKKHSGRRADHDSRRFWFIAQISIATKKRRSFVSYSIILSFSWKYPDEPRFVEFWHSSRDSFVGNRYFSILEIIRYTLEIVPGTRIFEKFQDDIITSSHPVSTVPRHAFIPEEPSKTLFDVCHVVKFIGHSVQSFPQELIHMGKDLATTIDAVLLGVDVARGKLRPTPVFQARAPRRSGR